MPKPGLTPKRIPAAKSKQDHYVIRDRKIKGLGLMVAPSGRKTFVIDKTLDGYRHKEAIGEVDTLTLMEARMLAGKRLDEVAALQTVGADTPFEIVAEFAMRRRERLWKSSTIEINRTFLQSYILPYFKDRSIASITRSDVEDWFAGMRPKPGAANRAVPLLSVIMTEAEDAGARTEGTNPVRGLRLYRLPKKERVLTPVEMARFGKALDARAEKYPLQTALCTLQHSD